MKQECICINDFLLEHSENFLGNGIWTRLWKTHGTSSGKKDKGTEKIKRTVIHKVFYWIPAKLQVIILVTWEAVDIKTKILILFKEKSQAINKINNQNKLSREWWVE